MQNRLVACSAFLSMHVAAPIAEFAIALDVERTQGPRKQIMGELAFIPHDALGLLEIRTYHLFSVQW